MEKEHKDRIDQLAEQEKTVVYLLSEDRPEAAAKTVAGQLHLDDYLAEILPDEKSDQIKQIRQNKAFYIRFISFCCPRLQGLLSCPFPRSLWR